MEWVDLRQLLYLKPLWLGMEEVHVVPVRTLPTLHPPIPSHCAVIILFKSIPVHQLFNQKT